MPPWAFGVLLLAVTLLAYWPALHGDFLFDDTVHISDDAAVTAPGGLWDIWFKPGATPQYYPLTFTVFWLGYRLWGLHTVGYHVLNVAFHGATAILLWQFLQRLKVRGAWLAGAVFALHPVCVMSVAWMTELKNTLSAFLALWAAWAYLIAMRLGGTVGPKDKGGEAKLDIRFYLLALALFQLALFAKSAVSFLPVTLLLVTWWRGGRLSWRKVWPILPLLALTAGSGLVTIFVEKHSGGATGAAFSIPFVDRILISGRSFWFYLAKLFFPYRLTFLYERWAVNAGAWWQYPYPLAVVGLLAALWQLRGRLGRGVLVALLHFFTATSLLILIVVPYFTVFSFVSDHWQYFGCMSVIALAATGMVRSLERVAGQNRPAQWLACGCLLLVLGVLTWRQSGMYVNAETLWTTTLERNPQSAEAHNRYGDILFQKGEVDAALSQFETSVALETNDPESHYNLGSALAEKGRLDEATTQFGESLRIDPSSSLAHNGLGKVLAATSNYDGAISEYQKALAARPAFAEAELNWGTALMKEGHPDEAMPKFLRAIEISPTNFAARINLGGLLAKSDHLDGAVSQFQQAVAINPTNALARVDLGTALYQSGLTNEAIRQLEAAAQIEPGNYGVRINLGSLLYQQHRLDEAINQFKAACELRPDLAPGRERLNRIAWILATSPVAEVRDGTKSLALAEELARLTGGTDPAVLATLAAALAETGNLTDAFATAQRASDLATQQGNQAVADGLVAQLDDYRAGRPYRDHATPFTTPTPPPAAATH